MMEWATVQHLDLRHVGRGLKPLQPHAAAFHPSQAIVAVAVGSFIIEFDALTGNKISTIDIGAPVVVMAYSPISGHTVIAILEDCTVRACDFDTEQTLVLHSPEKRTEHVSSDAEYVAYADGLIRAYNIQTYAVHYTLQLDNTIKLIGAGAFAFHPTLEWIFVGDRRGTLLAWDVSTERPNMIGITQAGSHPITSVAWLPMLRLLVTLSKDGTLQVWKTRVGSNPNRPMQANFFEHAALENIDITQILSAQDGEAVYPLPRVKSFAIHPKFNLAALLFADMTSGANPKNKAAYTREGRKQLFTVLQGARGATEWDAISTYFFMRYLDAKNQSQLTISDIARKAFLHSHFMEGHAKGGPITRLPLITISDGNHQLRDFPVCQPFHLELNFFNKENRVLQYPIRAFYLDGFNLMAYNLSSGADNLYKKLYSTIPGNVECVPKSILYSSKQHMFLVVFELSGANGAIHEVVLYWEQTDQQSVNNKGSSLKGRDAAIMGQNENQYAILDEDKTSLAMYVLPGGAPQEEADKNNVKAALDAETFAEKEVVHKGPLQFSFETEVDRIFSSPLESTILYAVSGKHIGLAKLVQGYRLSGDDGQYISTKTEGKKFIKLKPNENVLQVHWHETLRGRVAGILTTHRVLIASADLDILFDSLRITPRSLDILAKGSPVCGHLAVSLSQAGPQFTQVLRCIYAIKALRFSTALSVLKDEFLRSRDYPHCPPTSLLFHRFRQLGYACIKYGQFDSAKETFEVIADYESMLDLFICHLNPSAMRRLTQKLEEAATDSELRRYCERILRICSTGWTQGIFANFAAESMVPKGPEWGGGNWEIKTPTCLKDVPQWELAGEVMPYMKTNEGGIPAIIADHIGVYLGVIRGRGNMVEVSEKSLVKPFTAQSGEVKAPNLAGSLSNLRKPPADGGSKGDSIAETLTRQLAGAAAPSDEQAKAEEEFKRTLYGVVDGSSSDEDETKSTTKKIQIRIRDKPVSAPAVDVNKIKEATKQLKLGDGLGPPPMRTKSLSGGLQDISLILSEPTPATSSATASATASDMFGTNTPPALAPPAQSNAMIAGMGVSAGPIPEDFFQNTISSIQVAASLAPPGTYLSRANQPPQAMEGSKPAPSSNVISDIGLPDGGIPPQASQQPAAPPVAIGLPDGGVPPKSQAHAPQIPVTSQPVDLSLLEVPGSNIATGILKSQPPPPSPPTAVRPGQIPRGAAASVCFKTGLAHLEQNQLPDALSCLDEAFLALAKDQSRGADIKAQATICAQYKIAVALLQEITRLQKVTGPSAISAKDEMARLSRHLGSLPLLAKHRINCVRTAIKRNMEVQNYAYAKLMLDLLLSKAPPGKQDELRSLIDMCLQRGLSNKSIDPLEDPSQFCAATLSRLSTIGHDVCDLCGAKFSALSTPGCIICGMGSIKRSDALAGPVPSPFG
ncbi:hypothetical protein J5N97_025075 [Dioscorea zingiberensis]|uniref:Transducin/WD40 repeat-like superfamily protein n=1 Tax=Dioscorea zingiberensis TaxID=325984 RepID=A0A9D5C8E6_9LILI|nr:hypothetical protein J5N97_025075 [Dioscorea zingiberensis]